MKKNVFYLWLVYALLAVCPVYAAEDYTVNAELPATHIELSDESQTVTVSLETVKTALEDYQAGLFAEVFPAYTNVYFFSEDGTELAMAGLSAYVQNEALTLRVPANTTIARETFHLGKINITSGLHVDLRNEGYNFTIELSAGELMPVVELESSDAVQTLNVDIEPFQEVLGESFADVFMNPSAFVLSDSERNLLDGVTMSYTDEQGLQLTVPANQVVEKGKYYLLSDFDGEYADWRDYGFELYIVLSVEKPVASSYVAPDIVVESYALFTPVWMDGYAGQLQELMGTTLFEKTFKSGETYKFKSVEEDALLSGVSFIYARKSEDVYEFQVLVYEELNNITGQTMRLVGYDWATESEVDLGVDVRLNLTLGKSEQKTVKGELPATHLKYSTDIQTVEISTAALKKNWDFEDPAYFPKVFVDGSFYGLISEDKTDMPDVEMVYSAEKEALVATVYGETLVPESTFYLFDLANFQDFRDLGFEVSMVFSVTKGDGIAQQEQPLCLYTEEGTLVIEAEHIAFTVTDMRGVQVIADEVEGRAVYPLEKGIYIVRTNDGRTAKVFVK